MRINKRVLGLGVVLGTMFGFGHMSGALAQQENETDLVFREKVRLVSVPVTFKKLPDTVTKEKFGMYVASRQMNIAGVDTLDSANIYLVIDVSASMEPTFPGLAEAISRFVPTLPPQVKLSLITFGAKIQTVLPLGASREEVVRAIADLRAVEEKTRAWDVVAYLMAGLTKKNMGHSAIIVFSDGYEGGSSVDRSQLLSYAKSSSTLLFPVLTEKDRLNEWGSLAASTGGVVHQVGGGSSKDLSGAYQSIRQLLAKTWVLSFYPGANGIQPSRRILDVKASYDSSFENLSYKPTVCIYDTTCSSGDRIAFSGPPTRKQFAATPYFTGPGLELQQVHFSIREFFEGQEYTWSGQDLSLRPDQPFFYEHCSNCRPKNKYEYNGADQSLSISLLGDGSSKGALLRSGDTFRVEAQSVSTAPIPSHIFQKNTSLRTIEGEDLEFYFSQIRLKVSTESGLKLYVVCQWPNALLDMKAALNCEESILRFATKNARRGEK